MIIAKNDEDKRNRLWRTAILVSSVLIVLIAVYMLTKMFTTNPLEGRWQDEGSNMELTIKAGGEAVVKVTEIAESQNADVEVKMNYTLDKDSKIITIQTDEKELEKLAAKADGKYTKEMLKSALSQIASTFDYSVEQGRLTLTEREYGDQLVFLRE